MSESTTTTRVRFGRVSAAAVLATLALGLPYAPAIAADPEPAVEPAPSEGEWIARQARLLGTNADLMNWYMAVGEGTLRIRIQVTDTGKVDAWKYLSTPTRFEEMREEIERTVSRWRFRPALTAENKPVAGTYDYVRVFSPNVNYALARAYPKESAETQEALLATLRALKVKVAKSDRTEGWLITRWINYRPGRFPGFKEHEDFVPVRVRLHAMVPQGFKPARVYFNSEVEAQHRVTAEAYVFYNYGGFEDWLFGKLEERPGIPGHSLPRTVGARRALFELLAPGSGACEQEAPFAPGIGAVENPVLLEKTKMKPLYPQDAKLNRESARVFLQAIVHEDGSIGDVTVLHSNAGNINFNVAARNTISYWRLLPARKAGCPVSAYFTVVVDFLGY